MNWSQVFTKKNIVLAVFLLLVIVVFIVVYSMFPFRLKSISPPLNSVATSSISLDFTFSQPIESVGEVLIDGAVVHNTVIDKSTVKISLLETELVKNIGYDIELNNIKSQWFESSIEELEFTFTPQYIDFNQLSVDEQKRQIQHSNSGQINDPFLNNVFPIITKDYQIEVVNTGDGETFYIDVTFLVEVPDYDKGGVSKQISNDLAEKYRNEVIDVIRKNKGTPEDYVIIYSNNYLNDKYGLGSHD